MVGETSRLLVMFSGMWLGGKGGRLPLRPLDEKKKEKKKKENDRAAQGPSDARRQRGNAAVQAEKQDCWHRRTWSVAPFAE